MARKMRKVKKTKKHPGFAAVAGQIASEQGVSLDRANAILASQTRKAGKKARKKNPRLKRVRKAKRRK
jgi:hypothetical protein